MAKFDNAYSRAIAIVKVILPLVALAILSTLFLLSRPGTVGEPLPYSDLAIDEMARDQRLGAPVYTAVTDTGAELRLAADSLVPDLNRPGYADITAPVARITDPTGYRVDLVAKSGTFNDRTRRATLTGGVRIDTSDGYSIAAPSAWIRTDLSHLETAGPVTADGPLGRLTAGGLTISTTPEADGHAVALFHHGVKLVYTPSKTLGGGQ